MQAATVLFATTARVLGGAARARGWRAPGFRTPPRLPGAARTLRRAPGGSATVAVRLEGRPWPAVVADMVEGVVAANGLAGAEAGSCRTELWAAVELAGELLGPVAAGGPASMATSEPSSPSPPPARPGARPHAEVAPLHRGPAARRAA